MLIYDLSNITQIIKATININIFILLNKWYIFFL